MRLLRFLEAIAEKNGWPLALHLIAVVVIAWIPAQLADALIVKYIPGPGVPHDFAMDYKGFILTLLLAPLLETLIMRYTFLFLAKIITQKVNLVAISSLFWGIMHLNSDNWGIPAVWVFGIMGICYLRLQTKSSDKALLLVTTIHALFNSLSYGAYWLMAP